MTEYERTRPRTTSERVYRLLLRAYPADFRREFGDAMVEFFRDRVLRAKQDGLAAFCVVWLLAFSDVARNVVPARWDSLRQFLRRARYRRNESRMSPTLYTARRKDWMFASILQDVRYALRGMFRHRAFSLMVIATLTLGIGANAAMFSVVNGVLLRPLPFRNPEGIVHVRHNAPMGSVSEPEFYDYKRELRTFSTLAAFSFTSANITGSGEPERVQGARVSDGFFKVLGTTPLVGRAFLSEEDVRGAPRVLMLSYGAWQRRHGGDRSIVGKSVLVNGNSFTVVGIMPRHFDYPTPEVDVWFPLRLHPDSLWTRNNHYLELIGRLAPGASIENARSEINAMAKRFAKDFPGVYSEPMQGDLNSIETLLLGRTRPYLLALLVTVAFVLLIACVNVANLLLARGESRRRELGLRTALGASGVRLMRQLFTESFLFAITGGAFGLLVAWLMVRALVAAAPAGVPRVSEIGIDPSVLAFTLAVTVATGMVFGLLPALRSARTDGAEALKVSGKGNGQARGLRRARSVLVVAEVALAVVALAGAGLMVRSLSELTSIDTGLRTEQVLSVRVALPTQYQAGKAVPFYDQLLTRIHNMPGVVSAGAVGDLPIADGNSVWSILLDGQPYTTVAKAPSAMPEQVTPGYFRTMGIPLIEGREFTGEDREGAPLVVIVNQAMQKKYWPNGAIGHTIKMLDSASKAWATVIGVVKDVRHKGFLEDAPPAMYFPHAQSAVSAYYAPSIMNVVIKANNDPLALVAGVRAAIRALEPAAPLSRVQTMDQVVARSIANRSFATRLLAGFALIGLTLAAIGIYGVISYGVSERTFEIGLRVALGARRDEVLRLVVGEGLLLGAVGLVVGIVLALSLTRYIKSMLVNTATFDPATFAGVVAVLACACLLASWLPARRAMSVDPMRALRSD